MTIVDAAGAAATVAAILVAGPASAQTNLQLWGTFTVDWVRSDRLTYELEVEPKLLLSGPEGEPAWASLDVTPNLEFAVSNWLDVVGEVATGYTSQTDDLNSFELSPRAGIRLHLTSRPLRTGPLKRERVPHHRIVVRNLLRVEQRTLFYSNDQETDTTVRIRNRFEIQVPLNTAKVSDDGARYLLADCEWFVPIDDPAERFANRQRVRVGLGYRRNFNWRFEALYIWTRSRNTAEEGFHTADNTVNVRLKRLF